MDQQYYVLSAVSVFAGSEAPTVSESEESVTYTEP